MFQFLWDDDVPGAGDAQGAANAQPPASAPPAAVAPAPAAPAAGRARGWQRELRRAALGGCAGNGKRNRLRQRNARWRSEGLDAAFAEHVAANPTTRQAASNVFAFHDNDDQTGKTLVQLRRQSSQVLVSRRGRNNKRTRERAVENHSRLTRARVAEFLAGASVVCVTEVSDDATLWTRLPADAARLKAEMLRQRPQKRGIKRRAPPAKASGIGRNKATAVFNMVQNVIVKKPGDAAEKSVCIHSPAICLAKANWRTIIARKHRWAIWTGARVGDIFRGNGDDAAEAAFRAAKVVLKVCTTDAANTNHCVLAYEAKQGAAQTAGADQKWRLHWSMFCMAHQANLTMRPAAQRGDLGTCLVRLGNIIESSRQMESFLRNLDLEIEAARSTQRNTTYFERTFSVPAYNPLLMPGHFSDAWLGAGLEPRDTYFVHPF